MSEEKVKILYIGGYGRSGSTLLLRLLGQIEGFFPAGELWYVWRSSFAENQLCGCGQPFRACTFWSAVVEEAFGGFQHVDVAAIQALRESVHGNRFLPLLAARFLRTAQYKERHQAYVEVLGKLYWAIQKVSGARIIVDSSKGPRYAFVLSEVPGIDLRILHLVRDSRAVAYSWQRKKLKPEVHWKPEYMDQPGPMNTALGWNVTSTLFRVLQSRATAYLTVRYEDFVRDPPGWLAQIGDSLADSFCGVDFFDDGRTVHLGIDHTVSGNPNRFERGAVEIRPDTEWQAKMGRGQRYAVTVLTWPLLHSYGYLEMNQSSVANASAVKSQAAMATLTRSHSDGQQ